MIGPLFNFFFPRAGGSPLRDVAWGKVIFFTYIGMFFYTFGHAYARHPVYWLQSAPCQERIARDGTVLPAEPDTWCNYEVNAVNKGRTVGKSLGLGIVWPFFWAIHLQEEKPHE